MPTINLTDEELATVIEALSDWRYRLAYYNSTIAAHMTLGEMRTKREAADAARQALDHQQGAGEVWTPIRSSVGLTDFRNQPGATVWVDNDGVTLSLYKDNLGGKVHLPDDIRLCRLSPHPTPVDVPDSPGWWAFEGRWYLASNDSKWTHVFETEIKDDVLYVAASGDYELPSKFVGKWTKLTMPWDTPGASGGGGNDSHG